MSSHSAFRVTITRLDLTVWGVVLLVMVVLSGLNAFTRPPELGTSVAYLYPAHGGIPNVWIAPIDNPSQASALTQTTDGVYDFAISSDGKFLAYAERVEPSGYHEIMLMNLQTRQITQLTQCVVDRADCRTPQFRPSGNAIAYERLNTDTGVGTGMGVTRIWLIDLSQQPYDNQPLSQDPQFIGHSPEWSANGNMLAFFSADVTNPGILVYDFNPIAGEQSLKFIPSQYGSTGTLSPNGQKLVFPDLTRHADGNVYSYLRIADLTGLEYVNLTNPEEPIDDTEAVWNPDGTHLGIVRRYTDDRFTQGYQLYYLDATDKSVVPLIVDDAYTHGFFAFDQSGTLLVLQRFPLNPESAVSANPSIWVYNMANKTLTQIVDNGFNARWVIGANNGK